MSALRVALVSLKGGVGRTTLAAQLASVLTQTGRRALALDLDPQNGLGAHFGVDHGSMPGLCDGVLETPAIARALPARDRAELPVVPFAGRLERPTGIEELVAKDPDWLHRRVQAFTPNGCEFVFFDTPAYRSPWLLRALELADLVLGVVTPDPACYATLPATETLLRQVRGSRAEGMEAHYVINRFDASSPLARDLASALRGSFGPRLLSTVIREDVIVREALGRRRTVVGEATDSQVLADLASIIEWLSASADRIRSRDSGAVRARS
jgi:cellulose synthase operon protein YhjQ